MEKGLIDSGEDRIRTLYTHHCQLAVDDNAWHADQTRTASLGFPGPDDIPVSVARQILACRIRVETDFFSQIRQHVKIADVPALFEKSLEQGSSQKSFLQWIKNDSDLDPLRDIPKFHELLKRFF